mgnify:CR=1 FL=1
MRLFSVKAASFVKNLLKHCQERIHIRLGNYVSFLVNVEQNGFRRNGGCLVQRARQHRLALELFGEDVVGMGTTHLSVFQNKCQHFQQVRFTRAKKSRNPDAIRRVIVVVGIEEVFELASDFSGDDVFVQFNTQTGFVVRLDDAINGAVDWFFKNVF